jgi:very-short-patch-repair endonuclease
MHDLLALASGVGAAVTLVVEVDGGYHGGRGGADARRDRVLARAGWRVVRVPAALVARDLDAAVGLILAALSG